jgi:putative ABC transport system permease protein
MAARRAMFRWAWRLFRREWRQQLLVLSLIAAAVVATILAAAITTNTPPPANAGFGTANHLVVIQGNPHLAADISAIRGRFGTVDVIESQTVPTGLVGGAQLRAQDPRGRYGSPMLALVSGRYPTGADEVALTNELASALGLHIGDTWQQDGYSLRVVGLVKNPENLLDNFALVVPGQLHSPSQATVLFDATGFAAGAFKFPQEAVALTPHPVGVNPAIVVLAVAVLGLIFVGLVVTAGFTVLAQRRLRSLGMISSLGATDRDVGLVMIANGVFVGVAGSLVGAIVGLAIWIAYAPRLAASAHHAVSWTHLPWWAIAATLLLAIATAVLAALRPARAVARVSTVSALSGRPTPPRAVHRSALPGLGLLVLGPLLLAFSGGLDTTSGRANVLFLAGIVATGAGLMLLSPLAIAALGLVARRPPVAVRIALRDLVRYRSRSGAALAATSFAVLIAALIALLATGRLADPVDYIGPNLASNQLVVYVPGYGPSSGGAVPNGSNTWRRPVSGLESRVNAIAAELGSRDVLPLVSSNGVVLQSRLSHGNSVNMYVATPALLRHYGIAPSSIAPNTLLITSRRGLPGVAGLQLAYGPPAGNAASSGPSGPPSAGSGPPSSGRFALPTIADPKIQVFGALPTGTSTPNLLLTTYAVRRLKLQTAPTAWLIQTSKSLNATQVSSARQTALSINMTIETTNNTPSLDQLPIDATVGGMLLVLGVLAMTVGLIRSETQGELRTLSATGASSRVRRTIAGTTAGSIALLGALLGTAVAYVAAVAFFHSQLSERMSHAPTVDLVLILVCLPIIATVGGWLFPGRQTPAIARRPIE